MASHRLRGGALARVAHQLLRANGNGGRSPPSPRSRPATPPACRSNSTLRGPRKASTGGSRKRSPPHRRRGHRRGAAPHARSRICGSASPTPPAGPASRFPRPPTWKPPAARRDAIQQEIREAAAPPEEGGADPDPGRDDLLDEAADDALAMTGMCEAQEVTFTPAMISPQIAAHANDTGHPGIPDPPADVPGPAPASAVTHEAGPVEPLFALPVTAHQQSAESQVPRARRAARPGGMRRKQVQAAARDNVQGTLFDLPPPVPDPGRTAASPRSRTRAPRK